MTTGEPVLVTQKTYVTRNNVSGGMNSACMRQRAAVMGFLRADDDLDRGMSETLFNKSVIISKKKR